MIKIIISCSFNQDINFLKDIMKNSQFFGNAIHQFSPFLIVLSILEEGEETC